MSHKTVAVWLFPAHTKKFAEVCKLFPEYRVRFARAK